MVVCHQRLCGNADLQSALPDLPGPVSSLWEQMEAVWLRRRDRLVRGRIRADHVSRVDGTHGLVYSALRGLDDRIPRESGKNHPDQAVRCGGSRFADGFAGSCRPVCV